MSWPKQPALEMTNTILSGATIVDAMTTMVGVRIACYVALFLFNLPGTQKIMGMDDLFTEAVGFASNIDFSKSNTGDTVRYAGRQLVWYRRLL